MTATSDRPALPRLGGILVIDKPAGMTSRDVVDEVQWLVRPQKVGHAGTLDPLATGVLVVCLGPATRLISYIQAMRKRYRATFRLGVTSETDDVESHLEVVEPARVPEREEVERACEGFRGEIQQRPPRYSALKVRGRRAYQRARAQEDFELEPRPVTIHELTLIEYQYPYLVVDVECSSGTYIRSLARDLGEQLETGGVMSALQRTAIGSFRLQDALGIEQLNQETVVSRLLPTSRALSELPQVQVTPEEALRLRQGQAIAIPTDSRPQISLSPVAAAEGVELVALNELGELVAVVEWKGSEQLYPRKCFGE
jgi:tRNA pseudouridine55 synthase